MAPSEGAKIYGTGEVSLMPTGDAPSATIACGERRNRRAQYATAEIAGNCSRGRVKQDLKILFIAALIIAAGSPSGTA